MVRFAANLNFMFQELPLAERLEAAAKAGFKGVEFVSPYEETVENLKAAKEKADVEVVLLNLPRGDAKGDAGLGCQPGREAEFEAALEKAITYAKALDCPRLHHDQI